MAEATTYTVLDGNGGEDEVLPPQSTTKSIVLGAMVGSFLLSFVSPGSGSRRRSSASLPRSRRRWRRSRCARTGQGLPHGCGDSSHASRAP
jgi:hypothetical protein